MVWQFWFDICCCSPTLKYKYKGKNIAIFKGLAFLTWQLAKVDPTKSFRTSFCRARELVRAYSPSRVWRRRRSQVCVRRRRLCPLVTPSFKEQNQASYMCTQEVHTYNNRKE
jgi:hypothetical protein